MVVADPGHGVPGHVSAPARTTGRVGVAADPGRTRLRPGSSSPVGDRGRIGRGVAHGTGAVGPAAAGARRCPWERRPSCRAVRSHGHARRWRQRRGGRCRPAAGPLVVAHAATRPPASPTAGVVVRTHRASDPVVADPAAGPWPVLATVPGLDRVRPVHHVDHRSDDGAARCRSLARLPWQCLDVEGRLDAGHLPRLRPRDRCRGRSRGSGTCDAFSTAPGVPGRRRGRRTGARHGRAHGGIQRTRKRTGADVPGRDGCTAAQRAQVRSGAPDPPDHRDGAPAVIRVAARAQTAVAGSAVGGDRGRVGRVLVAGAVGSVVPWPHVRGGGRSLAGDLRVAQYTSPTRACAHRARGVLRSIRMGSHPG